MVKWDRDEMEKAFRRYWELGAVAERWDEWVNACFTPDVDYHERILGSMKGRDAIRAWIGPTMEEYKEIYTAYEWHTVDPELGKVVVYMQNRRDHPSGEGVIDFPGVTLLDYAGDGLFSQEEDYWALPMARQSLEAYRRACAEFDAQHAEKRTRRDWGNGPAWTRGAPTWFDR
jgi:hypothetical protein